MGTGTEDVPLKVLVRKTTVVANKTCLEISGSRRRLGGRTTWNALLGAVQLYNSYCWSFWLDGREGDLVETGGGVLGGLFSKN